jgi:ssDNA-binding Zn-finger/Zn-ribbon topoisomerase 1
LVTKQCPKCKKNVSLTQSQWDLGAELPKDCPYCNKTIKKEKDETREYSLIDSKPYGHPWQKKGA